MKASPSCVLITFTLASNSWMARMTFSPEMMVSSFKSWNCLKGGSASDDIVLVRCWAGAGAQGRRHLPKSLFSVWAIIIL
ncbi:hypothetical protein EDD16DRAFT_1671229 [Pisolithus croceorrhizus]|nr:hypothetical protein EDD16DRAFT_1671229 [Pisolithus croceorrhizus]KAI6156203.1 hypothetical protein EDD17DRAFT_1627971 [Pisolithus thermaeus]